MPVSQFSEATNHKKVKDMKRLIKFRGKRTDTGEWVFGDLIHAVGIKHGRMYILPVTHIYPKGCNSLDGWEVIPDTIGQFTGLLDKNGKEVYEGDVITVNGKYPKLVRFIDEWASFCLANVVDLDENMDTGYWQQVNPGWWTSFKREIKIIGNVFDNPELLKGGKE